MPGAPDAAAMETKIVPPGTDTHHLGPHDFVGLTFFIACNMMLAFAVFFFGEMMSMNAKHRTGTLIGGMVCFIAWYNYTYMKDAWVHTQISPTTYRYTDWLITVPLQMMEFYFVLKAAGMPASTDMLNRLFTGTMIMLTFGWLAEVDIMDKVTGFAIGMAGWFYILNEVFNGEAGAMAQKAPAGSKQAFNTMRMVISAGWCIYPLGFFLGYFVGNFSDALNVTYNLADLLNKGGFALCVWAGAKAESQSSA